VAAAHDALDVEKDEPRFQWRNILGSHSASRHGLGMEPWPLLTCLNVFRAVSKVLLNPYREAFTDDAIFDPTVDSVSAR
jgi:hypothetical protein